MAKIVLILIISIFLGCSSNETPKPSKKTTKTTPFDANNTAKNSIESFKKQQSEKIKNEVPKLILPPAYKTISIFDTKHMNISAKNLNLTTLLHNIAQTTGLNLIIDSDVPSDTKITLSLNNASIKDILDIIMDISGCYYTVENNILHVKYFIRKSFTMPYIHSDSSFSTELGGDIFNSAQSGGGSSSGSGGSSGEEGLKGSFKLKFDNEKSQIFAQIEKNIQKLLSKDGTYTLNKFSGILEVYDRYKNVKNIEKFIKHVKEIMNRQVLIEAKILEVVLNKSHALGVNWESVSNSLIRNGDKLVLQQGLALTGTVAGTITYTSQNFNAVINALDTAGDVDTLSNPRIKVINGQSAIISNGQLVPFWEKEVQTNQGTGGSASNTQVTYNRRDVLNGLSLGVTPTIMADGTIMLNIIPITSSIQTVVKHYDENGKVVASGPIMDIKEAATVIKARDNDLVLIGGLINNTKKLTEKSVPYLSKIPIIGPAFKYKEEKYEKRELVILIRLRIIK